MSGSALFAAPNSEVTDWWNAKTSESAKQASEAAGDDTAATSSSSTSGAGTPIFNDTLSAWFRSESDPASDPGWGGADRTRQNADDAAKAEPQEQTAAGLPRRQRGKKLMPGSANETGQGGRAAHGVNGVAHPRPEPAPQPQRDPSDVRSRLSSFQQGVSRGRRRKPEPEDTTGQTGQPATADSATTADAATTSEATPRSDTSAKPGTATPDATPKPETAPKPGATAKADTPTTAAGLPQRQRNRRRKPEPQAVDSADSADSTDSTDSAESTESTEAVDASESTKVTAAESTATKADDEAKTTETTETTETVDTSESEDSAEASATAATAETAGTAGISETSASVDTADSPESSDGSESWTFASDERWRTVQAASDATPSGYTPAGLPRRQRGQQLMPGSATSTGPAGSRPRRERDPADVQGRLSSFQQGIPRGRHRTAQASDSSEQKVEGE
ncbi:hypothetical protein BJF85_22040 [Saccharomonospora sp. CUA-673]|uniref:hypothetical protein n=1 Tax=Saccharomonospora sp. CUA-673 TaxID=1904969 RepID=UPI0009685E19|nr:hypothetical protein [Saccharomonospora sp. CUA-673]OLT42739.1 hypothetical protein BJF85_22040 [Saccharomonospora sp. CUA-673]